MRSRSWLCYGYRAGANSGACTKCGGIFFETLETHFSSMPPKFIRPLPKTPHRGRPYGRASPSPQSAALSRRERRFGSGVSTISHVIAS